MKVHEANELHNNQYATKHPCVIDRLLMIFLLIFSRKWILPTFLVLFGAAVCIRLGIWQLDRLEQRRSFNQHVNTMRNLPALNLDHEVEGKLTSMEWRSAAARGTYDFENQIAIRNQYFNGQLGYHLITPLVVSPSTTILVDRGWIPYSENPSRTDWKKYDEPGIVTVIGQIRSSVSKPAFGGVGDSIGETETDGFLIWNNLDLEKIGEKLPYAILDVYIQQDRNEGDVTPPIAYQPELDLTEGPHLGYALQWFTFALILTIGYPFYVRKQETLPS